MPTGKPQDNLEATGGSEDLRDQLRKERRLMILVSLVLLAHLLFGLNVDRSAETLGFKFEVRNPEDVWHFVTAIWAWALVRYLLFFHDYTDEEMNRDLKRNEYQAHEWWARRRVKRIAVSEGFQDLAPSRKALVTVDLGKEPTVGVNRKLHYDSAHVTVVVPLKPTGGHSVGTIMPQVVHPIEARLARYFAWFRVIFTSRYGTEYFFPFLIGAAPGVAMLWRHFGR